MGVSTESHPGGSDMESEAKLLPPMPSKVPQDSFHLAYIIHFILGGGFLLPWNTFITAVDYFDYIYPDTSVDRIFAVVYLGVAVIALLFITFYARHISDAYFRINLGLFLFVVSLLVVPVMDTVYIRGQVGLYNGFYVTVGAVALSGLADSLVQAGLFGVAGELPERYMQAVVAGTAGSGVLVPILRALTKAVYGDDESGLRKGSDLYFSVGITLMVLCIVLFNVGHRLPVMKYYAELKTQAVIEQNEKDGLAASSKWRSSFWEVVGNIKWFGFGLFVIYVVTLSIFPGSITEDVHSELLKDWYPVFLIFVYNVSDLIGKSLTAVYRLGNARIAISGSVFRLLFYPLFFLCLHGPRFFRTEIPVTIITLLLGLTNGYFTSVIMIMAPKVVSLLHAETVGIAMVIFLVIGLACGSIVSWFWVI